MRYLRCVLLTICSVTLSVTDCCASIQNGSFESGLTSWSTVGTTSVATAAFGSTPTAGTNQALLQSGGNFAGGVADGTIETTLGLPVGSLDTLSTGDVTQGSALYQTITGQAGDTLSFDWNFLTNEQTPTFFNDFAFWSLASSQNGTVLADLFDPGFVSSGTSFTEELGYRTTSFVLPSSGTFTLGFGVVDVNDFSVDSGLLIDNVQLASSNGAIPEPTMFIVWAGLACCGTLATKRRR